MKIHEIKFKALKQIVSQSIIDGFNFAHIISKKSIKDHLYDYLNRTNTAVTRLEDS